MLQDSSPQDLQVTPFTSDHQVGRYSALVAPTTPNASSDHDQVFMYIDPSGQVQMAAQSTTGLWNAAPSHFCIPAPQQIMTLRTYTTNVKLSEAANASAVHKAQITSSDLASPFINGVKYSLTATAGSSAQLDIAPNGNLIIIHETTDLTVPVLSIQIDEMPLITLDPVTEVNEKLYQLGDLGTLTNATVQDESGNTVRLLDGSSASSSDINQAAINFESLYLTAQKMKGVRESFARSMSSGVGLSDIVDPLWGWLCKAVHPNVKWPAVAQALEEIVVIIGDVATPIKFLNFHDILGLALPGTRSPPSSALCLNGVPSLSSKPLSVLSSRGQ